VDISGNVTTGGDYVYSPWGNDTTGYYNLLGAGGGYAGFNAPAGTTSFELLLSGIGPNTNFSVWDGANAGSNNLLNISDALTQIVGGCTVSGYSELLDISCGRVRSRLVGGSTIIAQRIGIRDAGQYSTASATRIRLRDFR
jgi:hypothetical protein